MNFEPFLSPDAEEQFLAFSVCVQDFLDRELSRLAADPAGVIKECKRSRPLLDISTLFITTEEVCDAVPHDFYIPFRLDEQHNRLIVLAFGHSPPYPTDASEPDAPDWD